MTLTKKQKILAGALGAAVAVFVGDRVLQGLGDIGPAQATASQIGEFDLASLVPDALLSEKNLPEASVEPETTLADRLEELARDHDSDVASVNDAFRPASSWGGGGSASAARVDPEASRDFGARHKLTATAVTTGGGMAIIDGRCLVVGGELEGFRLTSVNHHSATFERNGLRVVLRLAR